MKIHMCCGNRNFGNDWINIDGQNYPHVNYNDVTNLSQFKNNSIDLIYCSHGISYFDQYEIIPILQEWRRVLKPKGYLRLAVPDFKIMSRLVIDKKIDLNSIVGPLYGRMLVNNKYIYHKITYDFDTLKKILESCDFYDIHRYNWRRTEHSQFDDCSQAYLLPKMNKNKGILISLNVQCTKEKFGLIKHLADRRTYKAWWEMIQRCNNTNYFRYKDWGGRGIKVNENWLEFYKFYNDMSECPQWGSLGRINNNLGYNSNNCRWENIEEQSNNRRNTILIEYNGIKKSLKQWSKYLNIPYTILQKRYNKCLILELEKCIKPKTKNEIINDYYLGELFKK